MAAKRKVTQRVQNYSPTLWEDGEITGKEALALLGSSGKGRKRGKPAYSRQIPRKPKALNNANWMNLYPTPKSIQRAEGSQGENLLPFGADPTEGSLSRTRARRETTVKDMAKDLLYTRLMNSPEWREIRAGMQEKHPFCELHEKRGIKVPATCIHHIREVESGQTEAESRELCYNPENLIALCAYCHNEIHKRKRSHSRENVKQRQRNRTARIIARWESKVTDSVEAPLPSGYSFLQARQKLEEEAAAFLPPCPTEGSLSTHRKAVGGLFPIGTGTYQAQQEKGSHGADTGLSGENYSGK